VRTLIRGGVCLTLGARTPNHLEADVLVDDGRIAEIGRGLRARDAEVLDATDAIVMPGLIDTHRHTWTSLFRNLAGPADAVSTLASGDLGRHLEPDDVYASTLLGLVSACETGITTVVDFSDVQVDERYTQAVRQAHVDSGLRTVFVHAVPAWSAGADEPVDALRRTLASGAQDPRTTLAFGDADPGPFDAERISARWADARSLGVRIHAHAGVRPQEAGRVADLAGRGLLRDDVTLVHGTHLSDADLDALAAHHVGLALAPTNEMTGGIGMPPIQGLIDRGVSPGLGIGDEVLAPGHLFAQMRAVQSVQHARSFDLKLAGKGGAPHLLGTREVIRYATAHGARVAGLSDVTGTLEPGKQADVLILRTDRPNISPVNDPIGAVVWGMDASNVEHVLVSGRPLVRDGALVADVAHVRSLANAAHTRLAAAIGGLVPTGERQ
jgi:5-methylthioadenosine/S-adenosylhomocysteine deaminase